MENMGTFHLSTSSTRQTNVYYRILKCYIVHVFIYYAQSAYMTAIIFNYALLYTCTGACSGIRKRGEGGENLKAFYFILFKKNFFLLFNISRGWPSSEYCR